MRVFCKGRSGEGGMILTPVANGFCFGEGPRWFEGLLWFSDMLGEAVHTVDLDGDDDHAAASGAILRPAWVSAPTARC